MVPFLPPHNTHRWHTIISSKFFGATRCRRLSRQWTFKGHSLPLARIRKIMKTDEDVKMISAEVPVVFAKACEMFILELTLRSWMHTEENKRTLQKNDIAAAIATTDIFDFLVDIMPRDDFKEDGAGMVIPRRATAVMPLVGTIPVGGVENLPPFYYVAQPSTLEGYVPPHPSIQQIWPSMAPAPAPASSSLHNTT